MPSGLPSFNRRRRTSVSHPFIAPKVTPGGAITPEYWPPKLPPGAVLGAKPPPTPDPRPRKCIIFALFHVLPLHTHTESLFFDR